MHTSNMSEGQVHKREVHVGVGLCRFRKKHGAKCAQVVRSRMFWNQPECSSGAWILARTSQAMAATTVPPLAAAPPAVVTAPPDTAAAVAQREQDSDLLTVVRSRAAPYYWTGGPDH